MNLKLLLAALGAAAMVMLVNVAVFGFPGSSLEVRGSGRHLFIVDHATGKVQACSRIGCWELDEEPPPE